MRKLLSPKRGSVVGIDIVANITVLGAIRVYEYRPLKYAKAAFGTDDLCASLLVVCMLEVASH